MLTGYTRVSTSEQNLDLKRDGLERAGCEKIYDHVCSGRTIGRSFPHVVGVMNDLQQRGVSLKVLTGDTDTTTTIGTLVFVTLAEFECDLIHERTMVGLAAARTRGRASGRPCVMTRKKLKGAMAMMINRGNAAAEFDVSLSILYAYVDAKSKPCARANELLARRSTKRDAAAQA